MIHMVQERNNVFEIILELQKNSTYLRNLSRKTFIPHSTLGRLLEKLIKQEIIESKKEGNILRFQLKDTFESSQWQLMAEQYKLLLFIETYPEFKKEIIKLQNLEYPLIIISGKHASLTARNYDYLNLFIDTKDETVFRKISEIHENIILDTDKNNYAKKDIKRNHIIVKGYEKFNK